MIEELLISTTLGLFLLLDFILWRKAKGKGYIKGWQKDLKKLCTV